MRIIKDFLFDKKRIDAMFCGPMTNPVGFTIHNTGNKNISSARDEALNYYNNSWKKATPQNPGVIVHFSVDENNIYQHLPLNVHGWHASDGGNGEGNRRTIAIEIARDYDYNSDRYAKAEILTMKLIAYLVNDFGIPFKLTRHHDYDPYKQLCPHRMFEAKPNTWEQFVNKTRGYVNGEPVKPTPTPTPKPTPTPSGNKATSYQKPKGTYAQKGRFTNKTVDKLPIKMRQYVPNTNGVDNGDLAYGDYVDYQDVYWGNGFVWVGNGTTWVPTASLDANGKVLYEWGTWTEQPQAPAPKPTPSKIAPKGSWKFAVEKPVNVRDARSGAIAVANAYGNGDVVHYDYVYEQGGYTWAEYTSYTGQRRKVAIAQGNVLWGRNI